MTRSSSQIGRYNASARYTRVIVGFVHLATWTGDHSLISMKPSCLGTVTVAPCLALVDDEESAFRKT